MGSSSVNISDMNNDTQPPKPKRPGLVEYIIILILIAVVVLTIIYLFTPKVIGIFSNISIEL